MKIYLETKNANAHRIVFVATNGKLTYEGEWCKRKLTAYATLEQHLHDVCEAFNAHPFINMDRVRVLVTERPYKAKSFPRNAGPKKRK